MAFDNSGAQQHFAARMRRSGVVPGTGPSYTTPSWSNGTRTQNQPQMLGMNHSTTNYSNPNPTPPVQTPSNPNTTMPHNPAFKFAGTGVGDWGHASQTPMGFPPTTATVNYGNNGSVIPSDPVEPSTAIPRSRFVGMNRADFMYRPGMGNTLGRRGPDPIDFEDKPNGDEQSGPSGPDPRTRDFIDRPRDPEEIPSGPDPRTRDFVDRPNSPDETPVDPSVDVNGNPRYEMNPLMRRLRYRMV